MEAMRTIRWTALGMALLLPLAAVAAAAASPYLTLSWTRLGSAPIFTRGPSGSWDSALVSTGTVLFENGTYHLFYFGTSNPGVYSIGHATSPDGLNWTRDPLNPVLAAGQYPIVLYDGGLFRMWFTENSPVAIDYATSPDGTRWTLGPSNPVLSTGSGWDSLRVRTGAVLRDASGYRMYYAGTNAGYTYEGGLATSQDGIHWTKSSANPVLPLNVSGAGWDSGSVVPSAALEDGSTTVLWYTGSTGTGGSDIGVAVSSDGTTWTGDPTRAVAKATSGSWDDAIVGFPTVVREGNRLWMWYSGARPWTGTASWQVGVATAGAPAAAGQGFSVETLVLLGVILGGGVAAVITTVWAASRRKR